MNESVFDWMERARVVDHALLAMALAGPVLVAASAALLRRKTAVTRHRDLWVMAALAGPATLILWQAYNTIVDRWGLDSVRGLLVNAVMFAAAAVGASALRFWLAGRWNDPAAGPVVETSGGAGAVNDSVALAGRNADAGVGATSVPSASE